jgi:AcrR family transcriptional regulator
MLTPALSGRKAQAARNDEVILRAARAVFVADPGAPIAAVAERAGVGISALYRRYTNKEGLLRTLCLDGLRRYNAIAEEELAAGGDAGASFARWLRRTVDADTHSLTLALAGTFAPTPEMFAEAQRSGELNLRMLERTRAAGAIRPDVGLADLVMVLEQVSAIRFGNEERTAQLRRRAVELHLDALCRPSRSVLPGPPPTLDEVNARWRASAG